MFRKTGMFLIIVFFTQYIQCHLVVHTNVGWIKGKSVYDGNYTAFTGIPYGLLNQQNIYLDSTRYPRFEQTFNAFNDGIACLQIINEKVVGVSDCLVLNIYVPKTATIHNRLPVMVWFHPGGEYANGFAGKSNWGPKYLLRHNVIVVTVNYRLGIFGFMCLDIREVPGNQGLKDQVLALKWIQDNIYWFGGDTTKITLFGNGDSSRSVDLHLISSKEKFFNNVILQSGTALDAGWITDKNNEAPIQIVQKLGHVANTTFEAVKMMAGVEPAVILLVAYELGLEFKPCIEKQFIGVDSLISDYPVNLRSSKVNGMSIMMGVTSNEAAISYDLLPPESFQTLNVFTNRLADYYDLDDDTLMQLEKVVREFYIGDEAISFANRQHIADFESDFISVSPAVRTMRKYLKSNAEKVYFYVFGHDGHRNYAKIAANSTTAGACQGDELGYLFDMKMLSEPLNTQDRQIIDKLTMMWANFARTNNPTPVDSDTIALKIKWTPVTLESKFYYLDIDKEIRLKTRPFNRRLDFWNLFDLGYGKYQKGYKEKDNLDVFNAGRRTIKKTIGVKKRITKPVKENTDLTLIPTCILKYVSSNTKVV